MSQGVFQILRLELDGEGLHFGNFFTRAVDIEFSFGEVYLVMIFMMICHIFFTVYIDQVVRFYNYSEDNDENFMVLGFSGRIWCS
jgi:hypothetical protein